MIRPRRSLLFMPGSNPRALEKARTLPVDGIILDLEDAVAPDAKGVARDQIAQAIATGGFGKREVLIRINGLDTPWWEDDLAMAAKANPDGIVVLKVSSVADLTAISSRLEELGAPPSLRVWAMIETAFAILRVEELSAEARHAETRLAGCVMGTERYRGAKHVSAWSRLRHHAALCPPQLDPCGAAPGGAGDSRRSSLQRFSATRQASQP